MGGARKPSRQRVQELLTEAQKLIDQATEICEKEQIDGVSIMGQSFHIHRDRYGDRRKLRCPGWYDDDYWQSSTADCELDVIWDEEEE